MAAFPDVEKIRYEGPESKNPLAFRHYNEDELVDGKTMKDHLRLPVTTSIASIRWRFSSATRTLDSIATGLLSRAPGT